MSEGRQTVAGAYMKIAAHEELCAERYRGINEKLSWVLRSLVGMLLALLAWALVQLYALEPLRRSGPALATPDQRSTAISCSQTLRIDGEACAPADKLGISSAAAGEFRPTCCPKPAGGIAI